MITYQYAKGIDGSIVNILKLNNKKALSPYICFGCNKELIPRFPKSKSKHFAHKAVDNCSLETYLHSLAKNTFADTYEKLRDSGEGYFFSATYKAICTKYIHISGEPCSIDKIMESKLTKHFPYIYIERMYKGFQPDILLSDSEDLENSNVIFIEIAVTHHCEEEKINLGERIIEITITEEKDIEIIKSGKISENGFNIDTYNFNKKSFTDDVCKGYCRKIVKVFSTYPNGSSRLDAMWLSKYAKEGVIGAKYVELIPNFKSCDDDLNYKTKVREVYFKGIHIKNCFLCKYHGIGLLSNAFCKIDKSSGDSNRACSCEKFRTLRTPEAYAKLDNDNKEYMKGRYPR
ncbi:competence protein CoiA family protein [Endozoicomonas acroporae]|uniref:competence protein CoiA family protein n=1 Tax=Endozoicomonas acroporae TaxID=1701104 RepID=UPI000C76FDDC|nr:hypothetical protein [Endozoicomonas acroporae]